MSATNTYVPILQNLDKIKSLLEARRFEGLQELLVDQRELFAQLDFADQESRALFEQAQELTRWALTFVQMQHAHAEQALASLLRAKQLNSSYSTAALDAESADLLNVRA